MSRRGARGRRIGAAAAVSLVAASLLAACGDDGDEGGDAGDDGELQVEETDLSEWRDVPLDDLGFALSLPPGWEDVVLDADGMSVLEQADPEPSGFVASARQAAATGAVFYAAGGDGTDTSADVEAVNDLKVLAHVDPEGEQDEDDLAAVVEDRVTAAEAEGAGGVDVTEVDGVDYEARDLRFSTVFTVGTEDVGTEAGGAEDGGTDDDGAGDDGGEGGDGSGDEEITVEVVERVALAPNGAIYSVIVTGEDPDTVDELSAEILADLELF